MISRPENYLTPKLMSKWETTLLIKGELQIEEKDEKESERSWWGSNILSNGGGVQ